MNTKSLPAVLALIAGFVTCVMSFVQHVDTVIFARRFISACLIFFVIGIVISVVINMNFKEMAEEEEGEQAREGDSSENVDEDEQENADAIEISEK